MKALISRSLFLHFSSHSPLRPSVLFFHSAAGDDAYRRRSESFSSVSSSTRRNYDEENRNVKVTVWWDFENCSVPAGVNVERVANRITSALRWNGIKGSITITAFGDVAQMSRATQEALTFTGVCINHVPHSGKNSSDRSFMADLVYWVTQNPPPVHFFLISGDKDFANILHRLRMSNYNVLLACNDPAASVLCSAATIMWPWTALVKGENVAAKHYNHPPDGLYGSWYGHYKGVLDDPFLDSEHYSISQAEESVESISETKTRPVPRAVVNGIRNVLHSYPEGMYISELRAELRRKNIPLDKDFYGHKKFSQLLSSMQNVVKFIHNPSGDNQPLVADRRVKGSPPIASKPLAESADLSSNPVRESVELSSTPDKEVESTSNLDEKPTSVAKPSTLGDASPCHKETNVDTGAGVSTKSLVHDAVAGGGFLRKIWGTLRPTGAQQQHNAIVKPGFLKRIWTTLGGPVGDHATVKSKTKSALDSTTSDEAKKDDHPKKLNSVEKPALPKSGSSYPQSSASSSWGTSESIPEDKTTAQSEMHKGTLNVQKEGFFSKIANAWKSWKSGAKYLEDNNGTIRNVSHCQGADANGESVKDLTCMSCDQETHELFLKTYFWNALESFFLKPKGSELISKSRTRDELVHELQKAGPPMLRVLKESHLFHLVELLISKKKWVEESDSQSFPFKLTLSAKRRCISSDASGSRGLSSLFTDVRSHSKPEQENQDHNSFNLHTEAMPPQNLSELKDWFQKTCSSTENIEPEEFQKLFERKFNKKLVCSSYGYPTIRSLFFACSNGTGSNHVMKKKPPSREEILSDCHKLLTELLKENPEGFNISVFRPSFAQRYGYVLDYQLLGYPKLVSLLQIMPGVTIESSYILPSEMCNSHSKEVTASILPDSLEDDNGKAISNGEDWEELGPVSDAGSSDKNRTLLEGNKSVSFMEASLSDEEFTDSEDDIPRNLNGSEGHLRGEGESSLIQILDSWYSSKEGGDQKGRDQSVDGLVDCSRSSAHTSSDRQPLESLKPRFRSQKHYSFVSESGVDEKDKLVESILGSLKKAGDSKLEA